MRYCDFGLWVGPWQEGRLRLRASASGLGQVSDDWMRLPPSGSPLRAGLLDVEEERTNPDRLRRVGRMLFDTLFRGGNRSAEGLLRQALARAMSRSDEGLRIRLRLEDAAAAALPWELLFDPEGTGFLATSPRTALVRFLDVPQPIRRLLTPTPLDMLVVIPAGSGLDTARERAQLQQILDRFHETVRVHWLEGQVTRQALAERLAELDPSMVHFIGHAQFIGKRTVVRLVDDEGETDWLDHETFGLFFRARPQLKLVLLNACQSAAASTTDRMVGLAQQLVAQGLPAVIAMQYAIRDEDAIVFSRAFYHELFVGAERGRVDLAISRARNQLAIQRPGDRAVGTPVLFMRAPEGLLFDYPQQRPRVLVSAAQRQREELRRNTHQRNIHLLQGRPGHESELDQERQALEELRRNLRWRRASLASALACGLLVFLLAWTALPDVLGLSTRADLASAWLGDQMSGQAFDEHIRILRISEQCRIDAGKPTFGADWRPEIAGMVAALAAAGARVVALDIFLESDHPEYDPVLAEALQTAREAGTQVVLASRHPDGADQPRITATALADSSGWAMACLGQPLGHSLLVPLAVAAPGAWPGAGHPTPAMAVTLSLQAWIAANGGDIRAASGVELDATRCRIRVPPSPALDHSTVFNCLDVAPDPGTQQACSWIRSESATFNALVDLTPLQTLRTPEHAWSYSRLMAATPQERATWAAGNTVLVGVEDAADQHDVSHGFGHETRWGVEIHADMLNALYQGSLLHRPQAGHLLLLMLGISLLSAVIRNKISRWPRWRRNLLSAGLYPLYLALVLLYYWDARTLLSPLDGALAIALPSLAADWWHRRGAAEPKPGDDGDAEGYSG